MQSLIPVMVAHLPDSTSTRNILHHAQLINSGEFKQYDFGEYENLERYNSVTSPAYNLSRITTRVSLYYAPGDWIAAENNVDQLHAALPNVVRMYRIDDEKFGHMDFVLSMNVKRALHTRVYAAMQAEDTMADDDW